jgi:hypothetical protein
MEKPTPMASPFSSKLIFPMGVSTYSDFRVFERASYSAKPVFSMAFSRASAAA